MATPPSHSRFRFAPHVAYFVRATSRNAVPLLGLLLIALLSTATGVFLRQHEAAPPLPKNRLIVTVLGVGQGEAAWIRTPGGKCIVIGGGPPGSGRTVSDSLQTAGVEAVDLLILPYPYAEAIGGLPEVVKRFPTKVCWTSGGSIINEHQKRVLSLLESQKTTVTAVQAGYRTQIGDILVEVFAPPSPLLSASPVAANNSLVVRLTYGETRFLWAGGLEEQGEIALLSQSPDIKANWLRVARFGTRNASSAEFLRLVSPEIAVISVGPNRGGYPHSETIERLNATGAALFRTDTQANPLQFISDGTTIKVSP